MDFCHLAKDGNDILAGLIAEKIREIFS